LPEIAALSAQFTQENCSLREELAKSEGSREKEIAAFRRKQDGLRTQFAQEVATLSKQLTEEIAKLRNKEWKSGEGTAGPLGQEREAMREEMAELQEAPNREIASLRGKVTERDRDLREHLTMVKEAQEALRQELAERNGVQEKVHVAQTEEIAGLRRQQETFAQEGRNLKQQVAQSSSNKKNAGMGAQMAQAQREIDKIWKYLGAKKLLFAVDLQSSSLKSFVVKVFIFRFNSCFL
jgi:hypothetical protein